MSLGLLSRRCLIILGGEPPAGGKGAGSREQGAGSREQGAGDGSNGENKLGNYALEEGRVYV